MCSRLLRSCLRGSSPRRRSDAGRFSAGWRSWWEPCSSSGGGAMFVGDMNLMQSLWRVVTAPNLTVQLHWLPAIEPQPSNRHQAARAARAAIARVLQIPLEEHELARQADI